MVLVAAGLVALGSTGCATVVSGVPDPAPVPAGATSQAADDPLHIDHPKNLKAFPDPCQLLSVEQLQQLKAAITGEPDQSEWGQPKCTWRNQQFSATVAPDTVQGDGLRWESKIHGDEQGNPTAEVSGYPAVHGGTSDIRCSTIVGVSDADALTVHFTTGSDGRGNPEYAAPCAMSDKITGLVLANLPPA
ncbi:DUF3558 domain-containing protein [Saccharopolyspora taberi]|uniref:DUF3558 domain-containing protein n=1 Tax=Saccharopolyspora taberi TaxID=60895 RepID=A0ABN3VCZ4_9PSEU